jgi:hypothetical protein
MGKASSVARLKGGRFDTSLNWENSRERIRERSQRYAHGMNYPGNQITARPDQQRRYLPEEHPSGPIGPFGPIREGFDGDRDELSAAIYGDYTRPGYQEPRHGRDPGSREVPAPRNGDAPASGPGSIPRQRRGRHASGGRYAEAQGARQDARSLLPRQGGGNQTARRGPADGGAAPARDAPPTPPFPPHRRDPASGYPPRPGAPAPRYPQGEFAAWNEPATPSGPLPGRPPLDRTPPDHPPLDHPPLDRTPPDHPPLDHPPLDRTPPGRTPPEQLMASAPTWADTGDAGPVPPDPGLAGGGVALAERPGEVTRRTDDLPRPAGGLGQYSDDLAGYSDEEVEILAADFVEVTTLAVEDPVITGAEEPPVTEIPRLAGREVRTAAGRSRAAAAKARKAARRKGRTRRRVVMAGICVPAIAAVAAMAVMSHPGKQTPTASGPSGSPSAAAPSSSASKSMGPWQHIGTRAGDPVPLTLGQLFPASFSSDGNYTRTAEAGSDKCTGAVFGSALQSAVHKHGCSQVMRASYLSTAKKMMGTIGVLNFTDSTAASAVGKVTGSGEFIAQLTAPSGPTHNLTKGTGLEEAEVKGHYLILTWVEFTSLRAPNTSAEKSQLKTFSADLINQTANVSLTSRMVTGDPQMP